MLIGGGGVGGEGREGDKAIERVGWGDEHEGKVRALV